MMNRHKRDRGIYYEEWNAAYGNSSTQPQVRIGEEKYSLWSADEDHQIELSELWKKETKPHTSNEFFIRSATRNKKVTHLVIDGDFPPNLVEAVPDLKYLCLQYMPQESWNSLSPRLLAMKKLRGLMLRGCNLQTGLPTIIQSLPIKQLYVIDCQLTDLPYRLEDLSNLEILDVGENLLTYIPESIERMRLKTLRLNDNCIRNLPNSICKVTTLETLDLEENNLHELPDRFDELVNLRRLYIGGNYFRSLPKNIFELSNLEELDIRASLTRTDHLTSLDHRILDMPLLQKLNIQGCDRIDEPPITICRRGLDHIRQYYNDLFHGVAKRAPASAVAVIGYKMAGKTSLIKTLQNPERKRILTNREPDADVDEATRVFNVEEVPADNFIMRCVDIGGHDVYHSTYQLTLSDKCIPVIVTSMVQYADMLQDENIGANEAVRKLCFDWMSHLYISYPKLCAPLLVLTHRDCFTESRFLDLQTHFLETCEHLRLQLLEEESQRGGDFCLIENLSDTGKPVFDSDCIFVVGANTKSDHAADESQPDDDYTPFDLIRSVLSDAMSKGKTQKVPTVWVAIEEKLQGLSSSFVRFEDLLQSLSDQNVSAGQLIIILNFLHDTGRLLWYQNVQELRPFIFHDIKNVTELLNVVFHHTDEDMWKQRLRSFKPYLEVYGRLVEQEEFLQMYNSFRRSGIMNGNLLLYVIQNETTFQNSKESPVAISILREFKLIYGPIIVQRAPSFIIPHFSKGYQSELLPTTKYPLRFHKETRFKGLSLPRFVYNQMSIGVLNFFQNQTDTLAAYQNGVTVYHRSSNVRFTHDSKSRKVMLDMSFDASIIDEAWDVMSDLQNQILDYAKKCWPATRPLVLSYCSHCLLLNKSHPDREIVTPNTPMYRNNDRPMDPVVCGTDASVPACLKFACGELTRSQVTCLQKYIDENLCDTSNQEMEVNLSPPRPPKISNIGDIERSLEPDDDSVPPPIPRRGCAFRLPHTQAHEATTSSTLVPIQRIISANDSNETDEGSDISDGEGYLDPVDDVKHLIRLRMRPTTKKRIRDLANNTDKVYKMSSKTKLGRVLIINVECFTGESVAESLAWKRSGSGMDIRNLQNMFNDLNFELAELVENPSASEIMSAIKKETDNPNHEDYGIFFLVIMSHGGKDETVIGSDKVCVRLDDVYRLLSASKFPNMAGKPKVVIVQACAGSEMDLGCATKEQTDEPPILKVLEHSNTDDQNEKPSSTIEHLNVDDMLIMKSSFPSYKSLRSEECGSLFIRCLVTTYYKHTCHRDLWALFDIIQERVRKESKALAERYPGCITGQTAIAYKTLTGQRKVYLFPAYKPRPDA